MLIPVPAAALQGVLRHKAEPAPRMVSAAHEFEAQMMKELLKPLMAGMASPEGEQGGSNSALGELAGESLGRALSLQGGFGIANRLIDQLSRSGKGASSESSSQKSAPASSIRVAE